MNTILNEIRNRTKYVLAGAAIVATVKLVKYGYELYQDRTSDYLEYNKLGNSLAMDHLIEDGQANLLTPGVVSTDLLASLIPSVEGLTINTSSSGNIVRDGMELEQTPVKEKRHRRIGTHKKRSYASDVIAECRVRFGCPINNPANRLAVRRFAMNLMYAHGLRPTHVCRIIDDVVEMIFVESDELIASRKLRPTLFGRIRAFFEGANPTQSN